MKKGKKVKLKKAYQLKKTIIGFWEILARFSVIEGCGITNWFWHYYLIEWDLLDVIDSWLLTVVWNNICL